MQTAEEHCGIPENVDTLYLFKLQKYEWFMERIRSMSMKPYRLLIVGAGLTASVTSALIRQHLPSGTVEVHVWEKSRGIGGRMNTNRSPDGQSTVDLGAQYITKTSQYAEKHKKFFDDLLQAGILRHFDGKIEGQKVDSESEHFVAPDGINSVVKHFFKTSDANVKLNQFCQEINLCKNKASSKNVWAVKSKGGSFEQFDGVILTLPVPQILQLQGSFQVYLDEYRSLLGRVEYSSRYALALYYSKDTPIELPWTAKYVDQDTCIRFVCVDSLKRGKDISSSNPSILVHTSVPFGVENLERDIEEIEATIYGQFRRLFPGLPRPTSTRCIRWRYSQVYKPFPGQPGAVAVGNKPLLMLAGDGFAHSNFSGCIQSAMAAVDKLKERLA